MRVLVAPQEFKGSLTAREAAEAIAAGVREAAPQADVDELPLSDGGPGLVDAMLAARAGELRRTTATGPLGQPVEAAWALLTDGIAVIEMAAASGLVLIPPERRDPLRATTYGTGELIGVALDAGAREIIVGVGGSATVDAGGGALQALGARLLDAGGRDLPPGGAALRGLDRIDLSGLEPRLREARLRVASDVRSPLCGPLGAAVVFGPQKGASPDGVALLDAALSRFAEMVRRDLGIDLQSVEGTGAAGGLGAGLMLAGATIEPGFDLVADAVGLDDRIAAADIVITGEGRLDAQSTYGKTTAGVARMAGAHGRRVGAVAGSIDGDDARSMFDAVVEVTPGGVTVEDAMRRGADLVRAAAARLTRMLVDRG